MATFVERMDSKSDYIRIVTVLKECFEDGEIFNRQIVAERFMNYHEIHDVGEVNRVIKNEFDRVITNLAMYSKITMLGNGQYVLKLKKQSREEQLHRKSMQANKQQMGMVL